MNKASKVLIGCVLVSATTFFAISCESKKETSETSADTLKTDTTQITPIDTTGSATTTDTTAGQ
jgi:hypothetical protein